MKSQHFLRAKQTATSHAARAARQTSQRSVVHFVYDGEAGCNADTTINIWLHLVNQQGRTTTVLKFHWNKISGSRSADLTCMARPLKKEVCVHLACVSRSRARTALHSHTFEGTLPRGRMPIPNRLTVSVAGNPPQSHKKARYDTAALQAREGAAGRHWCGEHFSLGKSLREGERLLLIVRGGQLESKPRRYALLGETGKHAQRLFFVACGILTCSHCRRETAAAFVECARTKTCRSFYLRGPFIMHWPT